MENLFLYTLVAILAETIWENVKEALPFTFSSKVDRAVVIAVCVFICVTAGLDFPAQYGLMLHPIVGQVITGLVLSRGANVFHDLVKKVEA